MFGSGCAFTQLTVLKLQLPFFYIPEFDTREQRLVLDEDNSKHAVQVLRMKQGESLNVTNGKGYLITARIADAHKKRCEVIVEDTAFFDEVKPRVCVAISPVKNNSRFEWFLEKAAEIGVNTIVPLICERTEKEKFREERWRNILISAMLQSRQVWLTQLYESTAIQYFFADAAIPSFQNKYIAHCVEGEKHLVKSGNSAIILIGPEGDFTPKEIELALLKGFVPATLGATRLRTETAGIVAATLLRLG